MGSSTKIQRYCRLLRWINTYSNGVLRATSCWFSQNSACNGGAISIRNKEVQDLWTVSTFSLTTTNLTHNSATGDVAKQDVFVDIYVGGGAIYLNGYIGKSLWALGRTTSDNFPEFNALVNDVGQTCLQRTLQYWRSNGGGYTFCLKECRISGPPIYF